MKIEIDNQHHYTAAGKPVPSVTQIISRIFPRKYENIPESVLNKAAERGNRIHELVENYAIKQTAEDRMELELNGINYAMMAEQEKIRIQSSEKMLCYVDNENPLYAGKYDLQGTIAGKAAMLDIKTTAECDKDYLSWQLTMYALAYEQETGEKIETLACIWIPKKGIGQFIPIERLDESNVLMEVRKIVATF